MKGEDKLTKCLPGTMGISSLPGCTQTSHVTYMYNVNHHTILKHRTLIIVHMHHKESSIYKDNQATVKHCLFM